MEMKQVICLCVPCEWDGTTAANIQKHCHGDSTTWKRVPHCCPLRWESGGLTFSLMLDFIRLWIDNRVADDLRRSCKVIETEPFLKYNVTQSQQLSLIELVPRAPFFFTMRAPCYSILIY